MFQALRIPDFRLLWGGGLISSLGSWLLVLAVPAHILAVTGSLRDTGLTLAAQYLPQLVLGPVAGAVADGWDRRRLMIGANLFCAGAVAVMLLGTSPGRFWVLYAALAAENSGTVLYAPALQARVPAVVGTGPLLSSANSLTSASSGIVRLIGGPLGGVLLAACGIRWLIGADALSYLLAAAAMFMTSRSCRGRQKRSALVGAVARDLIEGTRVLRAQPAARSLLPVTAIFLTANAALGAVLIPFGIRRLGGSEHTGLLLACLGAGYLVGAPVVRAVLDRAEPRNLLTASLAATAGAYFLLFTSSSLATALPAATAAAMSGSMTLVIQQTVLQRVIPGAVLGRVSAVFLTAEAAATLVGSVAGPFLAQAANLTAAATAASLVTLSAAALALRTVLPASMPAVDPTGAHNPDGGAEAPLDAGRAPGPDRRAEGRTAWQRKLADRRVRLTIAFMKQGSKATRSPTPHYHELRGRAAEIARACGSSVGGPEHLFLGMLHDGGWPVRAIAGLVDLARAEAAVRGIMDSPGYSPPPPYRGSFVRGPVPPLWGAGIAAEMGDSHLGVEHAFLAMIRNRETVPARALAGLADLDALDAAVVEAANAPVRPAEGAVFLPADQQLDSPLLEAISEAVPEGATFGFNSLEETGEAWIHVFGPDGSLGREVNRQVLNTALASLGRPGLDS